MFLSYQKNKFLLLALIPALIFYLFFLNFGVNAPYADDISAVNALVIRIIYSEDTIWNKFFVLFTQCNEHRLFYLGVITILQFYLTGEINFILLDFVGGLATLGILFIFYRIMVSYQFPKWLIIPVSLLLFNLSYFQNIFWTVCALQHNSLPFFVLLLIWVLSLPAHFTRYVIALLIALLAVFTSGNGFLVFVAVVPLLLKYDRKYLFFWLFTGVACFLLYMTNYEHPFQRGSLFDNIFKIKEILFTFFVYLGSFSSVFFFNITPFRIYFSFMLGFITFSGILFIYWKNRTQLLKQENHYLTFSAILLFLFATMGLYSLARANEAIESVFESRYGINSTLYLITFILLILHHFSLKGLKKSFILISCTLFFISSYLTKLVAVANFSNELTSVVLTNKNLKRGYYFYLDSAGKKVDLTKPTVKKLSDLPTPIVNITALLPASVKYFNDVIYLSNTYEGFQPFNQRLLTIYSALDSTKMVKRNTEEKVNVLKIWSEKNGFRYSGNNISARISNGEDGVYAVLVDTSNRKWVFNLFWKELNRRKQLTNWDAIYVRNLDGIIPFKYLPDGKYLLKIIQIQGEKIQLIGEQNNLLVKGI